MNLEAFKALVTEIGFSPVPEKFRDLISNVALIIEDDVSLETRRSMKLSDTMTLLGLYRGIPLSVRGNQYSSVLPDTIALYRIPIIRTAVARGSSVRQVIEEVIWHEVAHHFGLNEREVRKREADIKRSHGKI